MKKIQDTEIAMLRFYNTMNDVNVLRIQDIPEPALNLMTKMSYKELCAPFIRIDLIRGKSLRESARFYKLTQGIIRTIGRNLGLYKRWCYSEHTNNAII
jgi:hypothetical protein